MAENRTSFVTVSSLLEGESKSRTSFVNFDSLTEGKPNLRTTFVQIDSLTEGESNQRTTFVNIDSLTEGLSTARLTFLVIDFLVPAPLEPVMYEREFPGFGSDVTDPFNTPLPGLTFSITKKPMFNTEIEEASDGSEFSHSYTERPRWDFSLEYEFLEDKSGANSSLKTILGFFLSSGGKFGRWLFKDPDDYSVTDGSLANPDGSTTQFYFTRSLGGFVERVGQVDDAKTITLRHSVDAEDHVVPSSPGPYTVTVDNAADYIEDLGVAGYVKVDVVVSTGQYSVDELTGTYTFFEDAADLTVSISYKYEVDPASYTITMPNYVVFNSSPAPGTLEADFEFFYVCRFLEDSQGYDKFAEKWWSLKTCSFRSVLT